MVWQLTIQVIAQQLHAQFSLIAFMSGGFMQAHSLKETVVLFLAHPHFSSQPKSWEDPKNEAKRMLIQEKIGM